MKIQYMVAAGFLAAGLAGSAQAATFNLAGTFRGNECQQFQGFDRCFYNDSPTIAKFNYDDGTPGAEEYNNTVFPSIDGSEFTVTLDTNSSGDWSYALGTDDPTIVTAFVVKAGNEYSVYEWDDTSGSDFMNIEWDTSTLGDRALSHITFFDTGMMAPVPVPAAAGLMVLALGSLPLLRRRRKSA